MNGRVYDASIGRFLSADPNIFHPFMTQNFNRYAYVMNSPLKYIDPSGFEIEGQLDDYDAGAANDEQSNENDFNRSDEVHEDSDGGGDGLDAREKWQDRVDRENVEAIRQQDINEIVSKMIYDHGIPQVIKNVLISAPPKYDPKLESYGLNTRTSTISAKGVELSFSLEITIGPANWDNPSRNNELADSILHEALHGDPNTQGHGSEMDTEEWDSFYEKVSDLVKNY